MVIFFIANRIMVTQVPFDLLKKKKKLIAYFGSENLI